ncbi:RNA methyltransferase [Photobacterium rosenbergii]|uniref:RNA methyltransferase n=1 Tax=Photobacterium rosenbergii TaxID=294936 RepID=UPI001C98E9E9|nr:RNA methyltransferase [Photobacterium rosenbergii]MBY5946225.1 RNA methyltransferase [Photobacterium rosenbergii]
MKNNRVSIGLSNPKSPTNVGAVMRAAGCYRVDSVKYTGNRYGYAAKFHTDTKDITDKIPLTNVESLLDDLSADTKIVCVELAEGATALPAFEHPENALYVFGPEDGTIAQEVVDQADAVVYVPTVGCMNLAATVNVLLYDRLAKAENVIMGDELIRQSRDNRNNLVVKKSNKK